MTMKRKRKPDLTVNTIVGHSYGKNNTGLNEYMNMANNYKDDDLDRGKEAFRTSLLLDMASRKTDDRRENLMRKIFPNLPLEISYQIADDAWGTAADQERAKNLVQIDNIRYDLVNGRRIQEFDENVVKDLRPDRPDYWSRRYAKKNKK